MALYRHSFVFEMDAATPVRLWTGHGRLLVGAVNYVGAANLLNVPDIKQLINGVSERIEFSISGVSEESLRLLGEEKESVYLAPVRFGRVAFDSEWQVASPVAWEWEGNSDIIAINSAPSDAGRQRTVKIGMGNADTLRSNPQLAFFTDSDQRKRSNDDLIFSHVGKITIGTSRRFGPK